MLMAYYESQQIALRIYYEDRFDTLCNTNLYNGYWQPWRTSYNSDIGDNTKTEPYFEDVLRNNDNYVLSQNVRLSNYYGIAMKYKRRWDKQVKNGLLLNDENMIPIDEDMSMYDPLLQYHTNDKHFKLLMGITIVGGIIIICGFIIVMIRWCQTCCAMRRSFVNQQKWQKLNEYDEIEDKEEDDGPIYETVGVEQLIFEGNQKRSRCAFTQALDLNLNTNDSIKVNDVIDSILDEEMPLLMDKK